MAHTYSTITDRNAELAALRDEIHAQHAGPQFSLRDAAECAIGQLGDLLEYAAGWDAWADQCLLDCYWPAIDETTDEPQPEPEPPTPSPATPAARKAAWHLARGAEVLRGPAGWLVPSGTRGGVIHLVDDTGACSCEAAQNGRECWHAAAVRQVLEQRQAA